MTQIRRNVSQDEQMRAMHDAVLCEISRVAALFRDAKRTGSADDSLAALPGAPDAIKKIAALLASDAS